MNPRILPYALRRHAPPSRRRRRARRRRVRRVLRRGGHPALEGRPGLRGREDLPAALLGLPHAQGGGTEGSAVKANSRELKDGPNFDQRKETKDQVLYAIENGGFSSGPMPQDIVVGEDAEKVADFVAKYSGSDR